MGIFSSWIGAGTELEIPYKVRAEKNRSIVQVGLAKETAEIHVTQRDAHAEIQHGHKNPTPYQFIPIVSDPLNFDKWTI